MRSFLPCLAALIAACANSTSRPDEPVDPCDHMFRAYAEDMHYVDVTVGAMPMVTVVSPGGTVTVPAGTAVTTSIEVVSREACGELDILGLQVIIARVDEAHFPFMRGTESTNTLLLAEPSGSWEAPSGWSGNTLDFATAYSLWVDWSTWGPNPSVELGGFDEFRLGAEDVALFDLDLQIVADLPAGDYRITHSVHWRDVETGTEVWAADFDHAAQLVTVE